MMKQITKDNLHTLKLPAFIDVFNEIITNPQSLGLEDALNLMRKT